MMRKICFLHNQHRDLILLQPLIDAGWTPFGYRFSHEDPYELLPGEIHCVIDQAERRKISPLQALDCDLDYEFILEYELNDPDYSARWPTCWTDRREFVNHAATMLWPQIHEGDFVLAGNAGELTSRLLHEICLAKGARFVYFETFFFDGTFQVSERPFFETKYGLPELLERYKNTKVPDSCKHWISWLRSYQRDEKSKFSQQVCMEQLRATYPTLVDYVPESSFEFVVGQIPGDANVVLSTNKVKDTSWDLVQYLAKQSPMTKFLYKPHPRAPWEDLNHNCLNILLTCAPLSRILTNSNLKKVHVISSTVGLEAQMHGVPVQWHSDTFYKHFDLNTTTSFCRFMGACEGYMFTLEQMHGHLCECYSLPE